MAISKIIATIAVAGLFSIQNAGAEEVSSIQTMTPLHGISFDVGSRHAASYFVSDNGACRLVLTLAEEPNWDDISSFTATRFEADIPGGAATRFNPSEGEALEFSCHAGGKELTVRHAQEVTMGASTTGAGR